MRGIYVHEYGRAGPEHQHRYQYHLLRFYESGVVISALGQFRSPLESVWGAVTQWFNQDDPQSSCAVGQYEKRFNELIFNTVLDLGDKKCVTQYKAAQQGEGQLLVDLVNPDGTIECGLRFTIFNTGHDD